ncbi:MAG: 4-hydroxythreonine-4-phosphate dehydrogenase 2 [Pseudomonadota bacterium]
MKPRIALFIGDPAGVGPELVGKLLADPSVFEQADVQLIGHQISVLPPAQVTEINWPGRHAPAFEQGVASAQNGRFMLDGLRLAALRVLRGEADALCFAPLNKGALRAGGMCEEDELRWFANLLSHQGNCGELNVLDNLWTSRVTSHVALKEVSELLSPEKVAAAIVMITDALQASGVAQPRIAVCGLNPHNGDNGNYGDEESRIIAPGVALAAAQGYRADGPFPADTAFVRAIRQGRQEGQGYDGVVTMYHDQGQIAMKLMGFERGVTVQGGLPIPITTPAHGTAYDIVGKGLANVGAMRNAFALAVKMGRRKK